MVEVAVRKAATLIEALPYIKAFSGKYVVIKLGGSAQDTQENLSRIFTDIDFMLSVGMRPVVVYGGGKRISAAMEAAGKEAVFVHGQRVTDPETMEVVARVLIDEVGEELLEQMAACGGTGQLLNGRDHGLLQAVKKHLPTHPEVDLQCVGEPVGVDTEAIEASLSAGRIPLVAPIACGSGDHQEVLFNVNGDNASAVIARQLVAEKLVFMFDMPGILQDKGDSDSLLTHLQKDDVEGLIDSGVIAEGMIPKTQACMHALEGGVRKAHIVPAAQEHALLLEIFTEKGIGTEIVL